MALPPDFWEGEKRELFAVLMPRIEELAVAGVMTGEARLSAFQIGLDNALANEAAARWARQHTDELLMQIGTTNERVVGQAVANWVETPGATMGDLTRSLQRVLDANESRASMIATTEVTRATAEGESLVYQQAGIPKAVLLPPLHPRCRCEKAVRRLPNGEYVVVWLTDRDEVVCTRPIQTVIGEVNGCRGLHGRIVSEGPWLGRKLTEVVAELRNG